MNCLENTFRNWEKLRLQALVSKRTVLTFDKNVDSKNSRCTAWIQGIWYCSERKLQKTAPIAELAIVTNLPTSGNFSASSLCLWSILSSMKDVKFWQQTNGKKPLNLSETLHTSSLRTSRFYLENFIVVFREN